MGELIFMAIVAVIAITMFFMTYEFPVSIIDKSGGAGLFPRIIILLLLLFMLLRTIQYSRNESTRREFVFFQMFKGPRLVYLILTVVYIAVLNYLGYIISTIIYLLVTINYFYNIQMEKRPTRKAEGIIVISVIIGTIGMYNFFGNVLNILLPEGILKSLL